MKNLLYAGMAVLGIAIFFLYTSPTYQGPIKKKQAEASQYNTVIEESRDLITKRDELMSQKRAIAPSDLDRLVRLLPDTVDTVRLVFDIDRIAGQYGMVLKKVRIGEPGKDETASKSKTFQPDTKDYGVISVNFSVTAPYEAFVRFIRDLEDSLRVADITEISFKTSEGPFNDYTVTLKTYWLK